MSNNEKYIKTGFDVLDKMLGGEGIKIGTSVLLRGQPGSGKTTLGLQIVDSYFKHNITNNDNIAAIFLSLEENYNTLITEMHNNFYFFNSIYQEVNSSEENISQPLKNVLCINREDIENDLIVTKGQPAGLDLKMLLSRCLEKRLTKGHENKVKIILIDSLNIFVNIIMRQTEEKDIRYIINSIYRCVQNKLSKSILIFTGEYHQDESIYNYTTAESFFADTEILLTSEPIKGKVERSRNNISTLGYDIEPHESIENYVESRSFCRVLKSRYNHSQSRRCSYDIESEKGLVFYETYPGDGTIILFQENMPQETNWNNFFKNDLPRLYPSLRYDAFGRNALQRQFAAQRRHSHIPDRVDMCLLSFDNYWINWYREFYQREKIYEYLIDIITCTHSESMQEKEQQIGYITSKIQKLLYSTHLINIESDLICDSFITDITNKTKSNPNFSIDEKEFRNKLKIIYNFFITDKIKPFTDISLYGIFDLPEIIFCKNSAFKQDKEQHLLYIIDKIKTIIFTSQFYKIRYNLLNETFIRKIIFETQKLPNIEIDEKRFRNKLKIIGDFFWKDKMKLLSRKYQSGLFDLNDVIICKNLSLKNEKEQQIGHMRNQIQTIIKTSCLKDIENNFLNSTPIKAMISEIKNRPNLDIDENKFLFKLKAIRDFFITYQIKTFSEISQSGLFELLEMNNIRLFGERRSEIIDELEKREPDDIQVQIQPIHRLKENDKEITTNKYLSIPYDANISFIVCNMTNLNKTIDNIKNNKKVFFDRISRIYQHEKFGRWNKDKIKHNKKEIAVINERIDALCKNEPPKTWEEMIALCTTTDEKYDFLIETQTFDTLLCTFMELFWSFGGNLKILPDYTFQNEERCKQDLYKAFNLIDIMFNGLSKFEIDKLIPGNCCLEPEWLKNKYVNTTTKKSKHKDWLFARHWYSTFADILTRKDGSSKDNFMWEPNKPIQLEILPMPVSISQYISDIKSNEIKHVSCWGDWHLAVLKGSENTTLAIDLINNLMGSQKITDRAFSCAGLPTVKEFYKLYGNLKCFNVPNRTNIILPKMTFNDMKKKLFVNARSRSEVFDYRHCIQEIHSIIQAIAGKDYSTTVDPNEITFINNSIEELIKNIKEFSNRKAFTV